jgi:hypothetical protein
MSGTAQAADKSTPAAPPTGQDVENRRANYNRLVRTTRLRTIITEKVDFKVAPEALGGNKAALKRDLNVKTELLASGIEDGICVGQIVWTVQMKLQRKAVVKCTASYLITYEGIENCSEETVTIFVENVGKVATYAYFRALYAHLDWSANLGSQPLPIVQFQPKL